jgi:hypothetical protein
LRAASLDAPTAVTASGTAAIEADESGSPIDDARFAEIVKTNPALNAQLGTMWLELQDALTAPPD